jgi:hypothetical protein
MNLLQRCGTLSAILLLTACGKTGTITVKSDAFATSGASSLIADHEHLAAVTPTANVDDFKICVARIRLQNEDGDVEKNKDDEEDIRFAPGLIDVTNGLRNDWGQVEVPVGFKLSRLTIKVKKDQDLCSQNYSVKFNNETTPQDIEFKWRFDPPLELEDGSQLNLSLNSVVEQLRLRIDEGSIASMKDRIESVEGSGH